MTAVHTTTHLILFDTDYVCVFRDKTNTTNEHFEAWTAEQLLRSYNKLSSRE
jgi:hypothetical protein